MLPACTFTKTGAKRGASHDTGHLSSALHLGFESYEVTADCDYSLSGDYGYFAGAQCANEQTSEL